MTPFLSVYVLVQGQAMSARPEPVIQPVTGPVTGPLLGRRGAKGVVDEIVPGPSIGLLQHVSSSCAKGEVVPSESVPLKVQSTSTSAVSPTW